MSEIRGAAQRALRVNVRGSEDDRLRAGDVVISKQTDELFRNGQVCKVLKVEPGQKTLPDVPKCLGLKGELTVNGFYLKFEDCTSPGFVVADDGERGKLKRKVNRLYDNNKLTYRQAAYVLKWLDQINSFELAAFATVHRSQGRTVDSIYIDSASVLKKPQWLSMDHHKRLLYTSITRARERAVLYKMNGLCDYAAEPPTALAA